MKIAIVGSGVAGLTVAHALHGEHDIQVFEAGGHIGGHIHTHDVVLGGRHYPVDSGFIVFNHRTYPRFVELLAELGVESQASDMSFAVSCGKTGLEYNGTSLNALFAQRGNLVRPLFWGMIQDILRFNREAPAWLARAGEGAESLTLGDVLEAGGYGNRFRDYYLLPMAAAIWSSRATRVLDMPAAFFIRFFQNHGLLNIQDRPLWRVVKGGSRAYVERLVAPFRERVHCHSPVREVRRHAQGVDVVVEAGATRTTARFDALFMACHSDQALALLADPSPAERAVLSAIPYQTNRAVLHTDARLLPRRPLARAAWNCLMPEGPDGPLALSYAMNTLQGLDAPEPLCVTLNGEAYVDRVLDPARVLATMTYHHPVFTREGVAAQSRHREIDGTGHTYYCGAWWGNGFHEDGVVSALDALRHFQSDMKVRRVACLPDSDPDHAQRPVRRYG
jgi:uncharacterized protein